VSSEEPKYEFDTSFQTKIAACVLKDASFNGKTVGLIKPEYFENSAEAALVNLVIKYYEKYERTPDVSTLISLIKKDVDAKIIRKDLVVDVKASVVSLKKEDIGDVDYVVEEVASFAKHQAVETAILNSVDLLERRDFPAIEKAVSKALEVGANEDVDNYDFFSDVALESREKLRNDRLSGAKSKKVISTGVKGLDKRLFHKGWARQELYVLMGPPKSGKSIALANFAKNASVQGYNTLFATLEVSTDVAAERIDSSITGIELNDIENRSVEAKDKVKAMRDSAGKLMIEQFPTGTLTTRELGRVIQKYKSRGIVFDMVVVDYADIMAPNIRSNEPIENSKSIYVDLRALAQVEDVVMLSAMQTNREGAKVTTAKMEHAAEDFNKIRIPDLVISINATPEEKKRNEARLFFVASRNQEGEFSIHIQQNLASMRFLTKILKIE